LGRGSQEKTNGIYGGEKSSTGGKGNAGRKKSEEQKQRASWQEASYVLPIAREGKGIKEEIYRGITGPIKRGKHLLRADDLRGRGEQCPSNRSVKIKNHSPVKASHS